MTVDVEISGITHTVSVERAGRAGRFRVTLDGAVFILDAARAGEYGLSIVGWTGSGDTPVPDRDAGSPEKVTSSTELHVTPAGTPGELLVTLRGRTAIVRLNGRRLARAPDTGAQSHGQAAISAPMPGRVVRVLVAPGDEVSARQALVVVEAMKMENELRAPRAGRVKEVSVTAGCSVEAGRILAVIE